MDLLPDKGRLAGFLPYGLPSSAKRERGKFVQKKTTPSARTPLLESRLIHDLPGPCAPTRNSYKLRRNIITASRSIRVVARFVLRDWQKRPIMEGNDLYVLPGLFPKVRKEHGRHVLVSDILLPKPLFQFRLFDGL